MGELGLALGTCTTIEATIFAGRELNTLGSDGRYMLRVTRVGDATLAQPVLIDFSVPGFVKAKVASDEFSLYKLKHGEETGGIKGSEIPELEKGYVGKHVRLAGYETGAFAGIPSALPAGAPIWQDRGFGFSTWFVVLVER